MNNLLELKPDTVEHVRKLNNLEKNEKLEQLIDILDAWIKKQDCFVKKNYDRKYLESILLASKGSIEIAKTKMHKMCTMRTLLPNFFQFSDIEVEFGNLLKTQGAGVPYPKLTPEHYRILPSKIYRGPHFDSLRFMDFYRLFIMMLEFLKLHDCCAGYVFIIDLTDVDMKDILAKVNLMEFKQVASIALEGQGIKLKNILYVSSSKAVETVVKLVKSVLSAKLASRVHVHKNYESLHKVISKDLLPEEMGGTGRSLKGLQAEWLDFLTKKDNVEYLKDIQNAGIDERVKKIDRGEFADLSGSFVSLSVD